MNSDGSKRSRRPSLKERFSYRFDNLMTKGMVAKVGVLLGFTLLCIILAGLLVSIIVGNMGLRGSIWQSFLHAIDPGTIAGDEGNLLYVFFMFLITIFGLLFTGTLIGILNNGMEEKMETLSKGKSRVLERGHTVVLGYNDITIAILGELMEANKNHRLVPVVVMDRERAVDMEDEIHNALGSDRHTKLICRTGCIYDFNDLEICSLHDCKSIIINAMDDFDTIKAILACKGKLDEIEAEDIDNSDVYITAVIRDEANEAEARLAGGRRLKLIVYPRIMAKIIAGAGRQVGLSYVYTELFNYEGNEIYCDYIHPANSLTEQTKIHQINHFLEDSIVIGGIPKAAGYSSLERDYEVHQEKARDLYFTFPTFPKRMTFKDFNKFFILEEDDDPINILSDSKSEHRIREEHIRPRKLLDLDPVKILIVGVSPMLKQILFELDGYYAGMCKDVEIVLADDEPIDLNEYKLPNQENYKALWMTPVENVDVYDYDVLDQILDDKVTSIMLLTEDMEEQSKEDERVLMQLIYLREIRRKHNYDFNITCEMNLGANRKLAELTGRSDFVVGSTVTALIMTQISEYHELYELFEELLSNNGSEIYMRKAKTYMNFTGPVLKTDFYTMSEAAARKQEVLIGIQQLVNRNPKSTRHEYNEPVLNPAKWTGDNRGGKKLMEYELLPDDLLVVIASN